MSTMGERIRQSRERKGFLQAQLAKMIGVKSSGVISNWEKDINKPDGEKMIALCEALDISLSYLLDYYGPEKAPDTTKVAPGDEVISLEESNKLLVALGYITEGEDLSDADLAFLTHVIGLLDAWFDQRHQGSVDQSGMPA